jgi:hypothetical protein
MTYLLMIEITAHSTYGHHSMERTNMPTLMPLI